MNSDEEEAKPKSESLKRLKDPNFQFPIYNSLAENNCWKLDIRALCFRATLSCQYFVCGKFIWSLVLAVLRCAVNCLTEWIMIVFVTQACKKETKVLQLERKRKKCISQCLGQLKLYFYKTLYGLSGPSEQREIKSKSPVFPSEQ